VLLFCESSAGAKHSEGGRDDSDRKDGARDEAAVGTETGEYLIQRVYSRFLDSNLPGWFFRKDVSRKDYSRMVTFPESKQKSFCKTSASTTIKITIRESCRPGAVSSGKKLLGKVTIRETTVTHTKWSRMWEPVSLLRLTLSNLNRFATFFNCVKEEESPLLKYVATLPCEITDTFKYDANLE